jgi:hypothetical protein
MLKLSSAEDERAGGLLMEWWSGDGAARVLARDGDALLLERAEGTASLVRDIAKTDAYIISRRERKKVEMLFAYLKRILRLDRLRLRGPCGARDEFHSPPLLRTSASSPS